MPREQQQSVEVINVRFPSEIVSILDSLVDKGMYQSRSEAVRDILRNHVLEQ